VGAVRYRSGMLLARAGLSPVMVGRAAELARLRAVLAPGGPARVALVAGEGGVGKTRLVTEALAVLPAGAVVMTGRAEQGALGHPYGLLLEAVEPLVTGWTEPPGPLAARAEALRALLAPVAPGLGRPGGDPVTGEELLRAAVELVRHLAGDGPGVLVFEDLHWADAESIGLLGRLAATPGLGLAVVGTYRPEGTAGGQVATLLAGLDRAIPVEHIDLDRLPEPALGELLAAVYGRPVPAAVAESLYRRTLGNPFFIEELLVTARGAPPETLAGLPLPASLTEAVLGHLDQLDPEARRIAEAAAVLGQRIPFDLLAAVTGTGEEALIAVLRALVGAGLIVEEDTDLFSFRHALTREAVAVRLLGRERRRLHERALTELTRSGSDDWSALAAHAAGAGRDAELLDAATRGAERYLRSGATVQALRLARLGLEHAGADDARLHELAARAAWSAGRRPEALELATRWRELAEGDDPQSVRALLLARLRWEDGRAGGQAEALDEALKVAERIGPSAELAAVYNQVAESRMLTLDQAGAIQWADRALAMADQVGARHLHPVILVNKASAILDIPGRADEAVGLLERAAEEAEAAGDLLAALRALNNVGQTMYLWWPVERTRALIRRMRGIVERSGRHDWAGKIGGWERSLLANVEGDLVAALATLEAATLDAPEDLRGERWLALERADLLFETGELEVSSALLERAVAEAAAVGDLEQQAWAGGVRVQIAALRGDTGRMGDLLDALTAVFEGDEWLQAHTGEAWTSALFAAVRAGLDPADARARHAATLTGERPAEPLVADPAWPRQLEAALLEAEGDHEAAIARWRGALDSGGRHRRPTLVAEARMGLARALAETGDLTGARAEAERAVRLLDRWPGWRRERAESLLRRLGGGPAGADDGPLTPREREVAALVATGLSNAEVGAKLFISAKTASVHVSNILAKLGMSSRAEIAAWAARRGLEP